MTMKNKIINLIQDEINSPVGWKAVDIEMEVDKLYKAYLKALLERIKKLEE